MADSGIDVDIMSFATADVDLASEQPNFYELKSKVVVGRLVYFLRSIVNLSSIA